MRRLIIFHAKILIFSGLLMTLCNINLIVCQEETPEATTAAAGDATTAASNTTNTDNSTNTTDTNPNKKTRPNSTHSREGVKDDFDSVESVNRSMKNLLLTGLFRTMLDRDVLRHDKNYYNFLFMQSAPFTKMWKIYKAINNKQYFREYDDEKAKFVFLENLKKILSHRLSRSESAIQRIQSPESTLLYIDGDTDKHFFP